MNPGTHCFILQSNQFSYEDSLSSVHSKWFIRTSCQRCFSSSVRQMVVKCWYHSSYHSHFWRAGRWDISPPSPTWGLPRRRLAEVCSCHMSPPCWVDSRTRLSQSGCHVSLCHHITASFDERWCWGALKLPDRTEMMLWLTGILSIKEVAVIMSLAALVKVSVKCVFDHITASFDERQQVLEQLCFSGTFPQTKLTSDLDFFQEVIFCGSVI